MALDDIEERLDDMADQPIFVPIPIPIDIPALITVVP
jgi:hypothetical protein